MNYNFDDYLNVVKQNIKNKKLHAPICAELESHLQDSADFYVEIGYDERTAKYKALEDMGPPRLVAENLGKIHNLSVKQYLVLVAYHIAVVGSFISKLFVPDYIPDYGMNNSFVWLKHFSLFALLMFWGIWLAFNYKRKTPAVTSVITLVSGLPCVWWFSLALTHLITGKLQYFSSKMLLADELWFDLTLPYILAVAVSVLICIFSVTAVILAIRTNNSPFRSCKKIQTFVCAVFAVLILAFSVTFAVTYHEVERQEEAYAQEFSDLRTRFFEFIQNDGNQFKGDVEEILACFNDVDFTQKAEVAENGQKITKLKGQKGVAILTFSVCKEKSFDAEITFDEITFSSTNILGFFSRKSLFNHKGYILTDSDTFNLIDENFRLISHDNTIAECMGIFRGINYFDLQYSFDAESDCRYFNIHFFGPEFFIFGSNQYYITEQNGRLIEKDSILD